MTMLVGAAAETIAVRGAVSLVDVRNSALSAVIEERQIEQLPLNGRNFIDLALTEPGVQAFRTRQTGGLAGRGQQLNINGASGRSNSYLLDGANMKSYHGVAVSSAADTTPGVETVREFRVVTNAFSADYGRAMGGVINIVTKAGSNDVHGSAIGLSAPLRAARFGTGVKSSQIILGGPRRYFDPNAFELQPAGFLGNAGRNILTGPKLVNFDLSLVKSHDLPAGSRLQLRFEVFNVFNRANFSIPDRLVFSGAREGEAPLPSAGQIRSTITDARQVQLGVKLTF